MEQLLAGGSALRRLLEQNHCVLTASSAWSSSVVSHGSLKVPFLALFPPVSLFREEADWFWKFKTSWKLCLLEVGKTDEHDFRVMRKVRKAKVYVCTGSNFLSQSFYIGCVLVRTKINYLTCIEKEISQTKLMCSLHSMSTVGSKAVENGSSE